MLWAGVLNVYRSPTVQSPGHPLGAGAPGAPALGPAAFPRYLHRPAFPPPGRQWVSFLPPPAGRLLYQPGQSGCAGCCIIHSGGQVRQSKPDWRCDMPNNLQGGMTLSRWAPLLRALLLALVMAWGAREISYAKYGPLTG